MPSFDSPSVFARLLDEKTGGCFEIVPSGNYLIEQCYLKNTNVLETTFTSRDAAFQLIDFMPCWTTDSYDTHYNPCKLFRLIRVLKGEPILKIRFDPRLNYGIADTEVGELDPWSLVARNRVENIFLSSNMPATDILASNEITLSQDTFFIVSHGRPMENSSLGTVEDHLNRTIDYWRRWVRNTYLPKEYQTEIIRSALTLKQLVYHPTGAILAAPTTSIPEIVGGNRNWDYRFCWLRDAYFIIEALLRLSRFEVVEGFISYLKHILEERGDYLRPMFTIDGQVVPEEIVLDHWAGYKNSPPVRIGNNATTHFQNDVYGEMVLALYPLFTDERVVRGDVEHLWEMVVFLVEVAQEKFPEQDNGLWEFRNYPRHYTFSKIMCWVALDRGAKIARILKKGKEWRAWTRAKNRMRNEVLEQAWNPDIQAFTQAYGSEHLDASTLLMPRLGMIDAKDPRMYSTIMLSEEKLMKNGLAFRYTNEDDFGKPENAFTICTFWVIDALAMAGQKKRARQYFDNVLRFSNHLGLFSEDVNPISGELAGNFPQGYTHVAIINTAMLLVG